MTAVQRFCAVLLSALSVAEGCRWALHAGAPIQPSALMTGAPHSLAHQSHRPARLPFLPTALAYQANQTGLRNHRYNRDGWGVGWYDNNSVPVRVRSAAPIVSLGGELDPELAGLEPARSPVVFGHVRAATDGSTAVSNAHPFAFGRLLLMHNGGVATEPIAESLRQGRPRLECLVSGHTDSEHMGALLTRQLPGDVCSRSEYTLSELVSAMKDTIELVQQMSEEAGHSVNICVTDGKSVVAARYRTLLDEEPPSLYYRRNADGIAVASEPLDCDPGWQLMAKDQLIGFDRVSGRFVLQCLSSACEAELEHRKRNKVVFSSENICSPHAIKEEL